MDILAPASQIAPSENARATERANREAIPWGQT